MSQTSGSLALSQPTRFASLDEQMLVHNGLLRRFRQQPAAPALLDEIALFIDRGRLTGGLIENPSDRQVSQSLLDYWASVLYRSGHEPPEATLDPFDEALSPELGEERRPYIGLDAFREQHRRFFFGRQQLVERALTMLREERLLAVLGPSGSGKSSLVLGGVVPALRAGALPGSAGWRYCPPLVPGSDPLLNLARAVRPPKADSTTWERRLVAGMRGQPSFLATVVNAISKMPIVLVVDQFEELFTLARDEGVWRSFSDSLVALTQAPGPRHTVILTMRSDFESFAARLPSLFRRFEQVQLRMRPMDNVELREAIERPAELAGLRFEEGIVDELVHDLLGEPAGLPLLQFTLLKLWDKRQRNRVTRAVYEEVGGGRVALTRSANAFYASLIPQDQQTARTILLRMVRPGEGLETTNKRIPVAQLYGAGEDQERIDRVLGKLVEARLVRLTPSEQQADVQVEIAHEALIRNWPLLATWLDEERVALTNRQRYDGKVAEWVRLGRGEQGLLDKGLLAEIETWLLTAAAKRVGYDPELPALAAASRAAIERAERIEGEARRQRQTLTVAAERWQALGRDGSALLRGALLNEALRYSDQTPLEKAFLRASLLAVEEENQREEQARRREIANLKALADAERSRAQAEQERASEQERRAAAERQRAEAEARSARRLRSLVVALAAVTALAVLAALLAAVQQQRAAASERVAVTSQARADQAADRARTSAADAQREANRNATAEANAKAAEANAVAAQAKAETALAQRLAAQSEAAAAATAEARANEARATAVAENLRANASEATAVAERDRANEQKRRADTGSIAFRAVNLADNQLDLGLLLSHQAYRSDARSETASSLLSSLARNPQLVAYLRDGAGRERVHSVDISLDGAWLAAGNGQGHVLVWDARSHQQVAMLPLSTSVGAVAFSPDSRLVAFGTSKGEVGLWAWQQPGAPQLLSGHSQAVNNVAFSPDGKLLASVSSDGSVSLWELSQSPPTAQVLGQLGNELWSVAWSPDGRSLAVGSRDGWITIWDVQTRQQRRRLPHDAWVRSLAWSSDGRLASGGGMWTRIWGETSEQPVQQLAGHTNSILAVAWSKDGSRLVSGSLDLNLIVWDARKGTQIGEPLLGHTFWIWDVAFGPDNRTLLSGGWDGNVILWDIEARNRLGTELARTETINSIDYSRDGAYFVIGTVNGIEVWSRQPTPRRLFTQNVGFIYSVGFSPTDPATIVATHRDGAVSLLRWQVGERREVGRFDGQALSLAFTADGATFAVGSMGKEAVIRRWDVATGTQIGDPIPVGAEVWSLTFDPTGARLAAGVGEESARVWDLASGQSQALVGHVGNIWGIAWSPDGALLATASADNRILLWEMAASPPRQAGTLLGHQGGVRAVAFAGSGGDLWLASGSSDGSVILWDVASRRQLGQALLGHGDSVSGVVFSADRKALLSSGDDGAVILWDLDPDHWKQRACAIANRNLTQAEWASFVNIGPYEPTCPNLPPGL